MPDQARNSTQNRERTNPDSPADPKKRRTLRKLAVLGLAGMLSPTALSSCGSRVSTTRGREKKVILIGLDGLDPKIVRRLLDRGRLPNLRRLSATGGMRSITSTIPPQSPVAWASVITGQDPGRHGIYDFLHRDPETYRATAAICSAAPPRYTVPAGEWRIPLSEPEIALQRRGPAFWDILAEHGIPCRIYRVPANFPPLNTGAKQISGLGTPDLRGTNGEYTYYTDGPLPTPEAGSGGSAHRIRFTKGRARVRLPGPPNTLHRQMPQTGVDFELWIDRDHRLVKIRLPDRDVLLHEGEWTDWVPVEFVLVPHVTRRGGICQFYLKQVAPQFELYVTPINFDPTDPALPIDAPRGFARELAERHGRFHTLGLPEDTKALCDGVLSDAEYLHQSGLVMAEARRLYRAALDDFDRGLLFFYFGESDRTQHVFWRASDPRHPAHVPQDSGERGLPIEDCYRTCDELVGEAMEAADDDTTLIVLSDHGFAPLYRRFHLNTWLSENGYLTPGGDRSRSQQGALSARWDRTTAYAVGLNGLYLNLRGREAAGIVPPEDRMSVAQRLAEQLRDVRDPATGDHVIRSVHLAEEAYTETIPERTPDLIVGYAPGYRSSSASAIGVISADWIEDNNDKWSGDHCIDRDSVPGILTASRRIGAERPSLVDVAASVLAEFDLPAPGEMLSKPFW